MPQIDHFSQCLNYKNLSVDENKWLVLHSEIRLTITGRHLRAARGLVDLSQRKLAARSGLSIGTIQRMERTDEGIVCATTTLKKVLDVLIAAGVRFLETPVGVEFHKPCLERKCS